MIDDPVQSMDPAKLDGLARVLSRTAAGVVPGLCRSALEVAFVDLARCRRLAAGLRHGDVESELAAAQKLRALAALALLGDPAKGGEVFNRLNRYGGWAVDAYKGCRTGGHAAYQGNLDLLVKDTSRLVERLRAEH